MNRPMLFKDLPKGEWFTDEYGNRFIKPKSGTLLAYNSVVRSYNGGGPIAGRQPFNAVSFDGELYDFNSDQEFFYNDDARYYQ